MRAADDVSTVALASPGINSWEAIGMLTHANDRLRQALMTSDEDD